MSELTITALRLGLFVLMWVFVFVVAGAMRSDLFGTKAGRRRAAQRKAASQPMPRSSPAAVPAPIPAPMPAPPPVSHVPNLPSTLYVSEGVLAGTTIPLGQSPITIGRSQGSTLVLSDDFASGRHARVFPSGGGWWVEDLGSTNGTLVGGQRIHSAVPMNLGTKVTIGHTVLELVP